MTPGQWLLLVVTAASFASSILIGKILIADLPPLTLAAMRVLLAAHYATVGTFVPTDVDSQIRHHQWQAVRDPEVLSSLVDVVDEASTWPASAVSARVVELGAAGTLSGHDGEWFSVRAGALGRALALGAESLVERLTSHIEDELTREAAALRDALRGPDSPARARRTLCIVTTLAHNLGDLSRVVEAWPEGTPRRVEWNKAVMAVENHRYLSLRDARALRSDRALLLPFPPWLDTWGETLGRTLGSSDTEALAEVVAALLEGHRRTPKQLAWGRALAGIHRTSPGGLERLVPRLPTRLRKDLSGGPLREALSVDADRFEARVANLFKAARTGPPR